MIALAFGAYIGFTGALTLTVAALSAATYTHRKDQQ